VSKNADLRRTTAFRRAAVRATLAPSVHNTQPWRMVLDGDALEIHAEWDRQLRVLDPRARQLLMSCGCAVFNARVALAAAGIPVVVTRPAHGLRPDVVARLEATGRDGSAPAVDPTLGRLDDAISVRQTNRRQFVGQAVPDEVVDVLVEAAREEEATLFPVVREADRATLARLSQAADRAENADPAYRAELRMWTSDDPNRRDGVPAMAVPHVDGFAGDDLPLRDFDSSGHGQLPSYTHSTIDQCLLLLGTEDDNPAAWVRAGEALERVLLEIARLGYTASPLTQVIEVPATHAELRQRLHLSMHPHVVLRVGRAPATPATPRRHLVDVLFEPRTSASHGPSDATIS
jgi:hypothetical protein